MFKNAKELTKYSIRKSADNNYVVTLQNDPDFVVSGHYTLSEASEAKKRYEAADKRRAKDKRI